MKTMPPPPRHQPWISGRAATAMGLRPLDIANWLQPGPDFGDQMVQREKLLQNNHSDVAFCPATTRVAGREILGLLVDQLTRHHADSYAFTDRLASCAVTDRRIPLDRDEPLVTAARLVQEDLCLLRAGTDSYELAAAVVCFPSRWSLAEKAGKPLGVIHGPVPDYDRELARPVDRFFDMLKPGRPVWRANWSLHQDPELFQPGGGFRAAVTKAPGIPDGLWIRVERQCLQRLSTGDILFTIRTFIDPLRSIGGDRQSRQEMAAALAGFSDSMLDYKNMRSWRDDVVGWLNDS
ncbi:MAG: DUF3445 domain-containing protein [Rhodospirillales bacterium]